MLLVGRARRQRQRSSNASDGTAVIWGADPDRLDAMAQQFRAAAAALDEVTQTTTAQLQRSPWHGADAQAFLFEWSSHHRPLLNDGAAKLRAAAGQLSSNAAEQRQASGISRADVGAFASIGAAGASAVAGAPASVLTALDRIGGNGIPRDSIEIARLDNGRYIVVLPGVTDLSAGGNDIADGFRSAAARTPTADLRVGGVSIPMAFPGQMEVAGAAVMGGVVAGFDEWFGKAESVRDMRYAVPDDLVGSQTYADDVKRAMQAAGVPSGSEVMIVGHSFGAIAAVQLASDPSFNRSSDGGGYHVQVTDVVAAAYGGGAEVKSIPPGTNALILANSNDWVVKAESLPGQLEAPLVGQALNRASPAITRFDGGTAGYGHEVSNYTTYLQNTTDPSVGAFYERLGSSYSGPPSFRSVTLGAP
jgi:hypothetical protein